MCLLAAPLVDGLLGEDPGAVELERGDAPLGRELREGVLVHGKVGRGFLDAQHVLRRHERSSSVRLRSVSTSASSERIRSTSCSSARLTGWGRPVWFKSAPPTRCPSLYVIRPGTPTTTQFGGTSRTTTDPAPMRALSPMVIAPMIAAPEQGHVGADPGGLADDDAHAVVDEEPRPQPRRGMDLDARQEAAEVRNEARERRPAAPPEAVGDPVEREGVDAGIADHH